MNTHQTIAQPEMIRPRASGTEARWLVVINHHEARVFRSLLHGTVPEQIRPHQADDAISHTHSSSDFSRGQEKPAAHSFFGPIADALKDAGQILIFGSGTGTASEMKQLIAWMNTHHPEQARRIAGSLVIDEHHQTNAQLLEKARAFYAPPLPTP